MERWEHGASTTCRSGAEGQPPTLPWRSTPPKSAAKPNFGTPGLCLAAPSLLAATTKTSLTLAVHTLLPFPEFAPAPDEFTVAWVGCARHLTLCSSGTTWPLALLAGRNWQLGTPPTRSTLSAAGPNPNFADGSAMSQSQRAGAEPKLEQRGGGEAAVAAACIGLQGMQHLQRGNVSSLRCHGAYA